MNNPLLKILSLTLLLGSVAAAADSSTPTADIHWKKITLSRDFMCEGANFGDFNHDGVQDVVSGPYWYEGPDFTKRHEYMPVQKFKADGEYSRNFFAFTHSFKNDGFDDIIIIGFPGEDTSWYENPRAKGGADQHWVRHKIFDVTDNESPTFADLRKNGKPVLVCMSGGKIGYAEPDWNAPEKPWKWHPCTADRKYQRFTHGLGFGDVNGDGRNDLLVAEGWFEQPASLEGDPEWKFHPAHLNDGGSQMFVYDVNGDGRADVITSLHAHAYGLVWQEQKADGSFEEHVILPDRPAKKPGELQFSELHAVDFVDINGDGLPDIVTGKRWYAHHSHGDVEPNAPAVLYWFELSRKDGQVKFIPHKIDDDSGVGTQVVAKDINHNHHPAIVIGNKKGTFVFLQEPEAHVSK